MPSTKKEKIIIQPKKPFPTDKVLDGLHSVFVAFVCIPSYNLEKEGEEGRKQGYLGLLMRRDGSLGFTGGKVDEGETLEQAAVREAKEEINCDLDASKLDMLCSHYMKDGDFEQHTHLMVCQVTAESLYAIKRDSVNGEHSESETAAFNVVHMSKKSYENLMACNFAGTGKSEFQFLVAQGFF